MSDSVVFDINGDPKGAEAAFARLQRELDKSKQKVTELTAEARKSAAAGDKLGDAFTKSAKSGEQMGAGWVKSMGSALAVTGLLNAALRVTKAEYDNIIQRQEKAARSILDNANAELSMLRNVSPQDHAYWRSQVPGMAQRTGQKASVVQQAIADASSAQGNQTNDQLRQNVELALMVAPENPAEAQTIAGGLGDASRLTGSSDARVNMGAILAMGKQARVRSTAKIAQNLIPAAVSTQGYGGTAGEAMGLGTTLSTLMNDQQGDSTKTASIRIASELDRIYGADKSPLEHITALQNNPELAKKWYKGSRGKAPGSIPTEAEIAFKNLITKGSEADKLLRSNIAGYGDDNMQAQLTQDWFQSTYATGAQQLAKQDRALEATTDALDLVSTRPGRIGAMRKRLDETLASTGATWSERTGYAWRFDYQTSSGPNSTDPEAAVLGSLVERRNFLRDNPNLSPQQRSENDPLIKVLNVQIEAMVKELRGLRSDQKNSKKVNADAHTE